MYYGIVICAIDTFTKSKEDNHFCLFTQSSIFIEQGVVFLLICDTKDAVNSHHHHINKINQDNFLLIKF